MILYSIQTNFFSVNATTVVDDLRKIFLLLLRNTATTYKSINSSCISKIQYLLLIIARLRHTSKPCIPPIHECNIYKPASTIHPHFCNKWSRNTHIALNTRQQGQSILDQCPPKMALIEIKIVRG